MTQNTRLIVVLFLAASLAFPRRATQVCGTYRELGAEEIALHRTAAPRRLLKQAAASRLTARPAPRDIGNIAILEDADGIVERRNRFNLSQRTIVFTRDGAAYRFALPNEPGFDSGLVQGGAIIDGLGDDDTRGISLPFAFPFFDATYNRIFVNSDGNLTFGSGDGQTVARSLGRMTAGPPRIAAFYEDLDPTAAGEVRVTSQPSVFAVSWVGVPEFSSSSSGAPRNTFQISLYPDGRIVVAYGRVSSRNAVVGIAPGQLQGASSVVSFITGSTASFTAAVVERFSDTEEIDTVFAAQKFYDTHEDVYDFLVFFNNLDIGAQSGALAFQSGVRTIVDGIGDRIGDTGSLYGSARRLQAIVNMGDLRQYPSDPNGLVPARSGSQYTPLTVLGHEVGHMWLALASIRNPANPSARPMLGLQLAHWAFNFNSEASLLEGNRIEDSGPGAFPRFRTIAVTQGYAPLDQYLMGLRAPEDVPPTFLVTGTPFSLPIFPATNVTFNGERRDVTVEELIAVEGRRTPDHTVSQRRYRIAFVLVSAAGQEPTTAQLAQVEGYRAAFPAFFEQASGRRAFVETTLQKNLQLSLSPFGGVLAGATVTASLSLTQPAPADLTILLPTRNGIISIPESVTIRAGQRRATFNIRGDSQGVEELTAEPADSRYATAFARIQVNGPRALRLAAVSGDTQTVPAGGALPLPLVLRVVDANKVPYSGQTVTATVSTGSVDSPRAVSDEDGFVRFNWAPAAGPLYELKASIGDASLTMSAVGKPFISTDGIVNSASYTPGLAPGALVTIFGASLAPGADELAAALLLPRSLGGVRVSINGQAASLVYVGNRQINLVAPFGLSGNTAEVVVTWGAETVTASVALKAVDPGIFVIDGARTGAVLIAGTGQTTLSRPAAAGDLLELYLTGIGQSSGIPIVTIGGRQAEVLFSGANPVFPGLDQINLRVPSGLAAGMQTLSVRSGAAVSNEVLVRLR